MSRRVPIGEVAEVNPRLSKFLAVDRDKRVSFLAMSGLSEDGRIVETCERLLGDVAKGYTYFERGDVLFAKITPCMENGKAAYVAGLPNQVGFGSTEFHVLRPGPEIDGKYLFYALWNADFRHYAERNMTGTAGQKRIPATFIKRYLIALPSISEQKRIVKILDRADALRQKRKQAIELLDEYLKSVFLEMFGDPVTNPKGWDVEKLGHIADICSGVTKGRKLDRSKTIPVPYMRVANVQDEYIDLSEVKEIEALPNEIEKYRLLDGDLLLTEGGDPDKLGRGAVWKAEIKNCIHQNHVFRVRLNPQLAIPEYISAQIGSNRGKRYFLRSAKQTTGIATINMTQLKNFPALLPPVKLQIRFADNVKEKESLKQKMLAQSTELETQFQALMQKAFKGELNSDNDNISLDNNDEPETKDLLTTRI